MDKIVKRILEKLENVKIGDIWCVLGMLSFSVLMCHPLLKNRLILAHDSGCAFFRLLAVYKFFGDGQLLVRWIPAMHYGYGYPLFNFYPPLFYYTADFMILTHIGIVNAINITCILFLAFSGVGMYLFAKEFFGKSGGFLAGVAYLYAPYHICDLYVRGAFAEFTSFAVFPFIMWSFYRLRRTLRTRYVISGAFAVCLLMLSHNIMAMLGIPAVVAYIIFLHLTQDESRRPSAIWSFLSFISGMMMAAFFWLPAILEKRFVRFTNFINGYFDYHDHFVYPEQLIYSRWGYGDSVAGRHDGMSFQIGLVHIALFIVTSLFIKKIYDKNKEAGRHLFFFAALLFMSIIFMTHISIPLWEALPLLKFTQFPWRFLTLATLAVSFSAGGAVLLVHKRYKIPLMAALVSAIFLTNIFYCHPNPKKPLWDSDSTNLADMRDMLGCVRLPDTYEYMPVWVKELPGPIDGGKLVALNGNMDLKEKNISAIDHIFEVNAQSDLTASFNTFYFPGWQVLIDGRDTAIDPDNEHGLIHFRISRGYHNVRIRFGYSKTRMIAVLLSYISILFLAFLILAFRPKRLK